MPLGNLGRANRILAGIESYENELRCKLEQVLCRLAIYLRYRNAGILGLLRIVAGIVRDGGLECRFSGGIAYDALRGKLTRVHRDIDLVFLAGHRGKVLAAFAGAGFRLEEKSPYHTTAHADNGLAVDLFGWVETAGGRAEQIVDGAMVRLPRSFFAARQTAELRGIRLVLPGNEYLKGILPFVESELDRLFIAGLESDPRMQRVTRVEPVMRRINLTVHEFTISADEPGGAPKA